MPASCLQTHTPRHLIDRKALWDTYRKFGRVTPPTEPRRILRNYRGKAEFETKKHIQRFYTTCNSTKSNFYTWLYRVRLTSSDHLHSQNDFYSHGSLCKRDEIIVLNDALTQLVRRTCKFRLKGTKLSKRFAKTTSRFKIIFAVCRQKTPCNQSDRPTCNHVIHGNSQGNSHSRKRKIYSK